ncbi:MAG TPA: CheB methylesterase domain-containing protein [Gallionella sp.]|nr:CheB methylesterase domain-containing protein [Gallionella sp.]
MHNKAGLQPFGPRVVVVGSSTGGTDALRVFLSAMPSSSPAILIAQHMPESFTQSFAERLDSFCGMKVKEAGHHEKIQPGFVYLSPGHSHLSLERADNGYRTVLNQDPPVNRHRPSVEVLFRAAAKVLGGNAIGVMLTGMGKDGAAAMLEMHQAGAYNFAQDEASCVVFGMPREAIALGAVDEVVPLDNMAGRVIAAAARRL